MTIKLTPDPTASDQIPRRKTSSGGEGGPLVIPPGAQPLTGKKQCPTCKRMVATVPKLRKGSCKCLWYQRTTTFIDVLQDEFLLKQWGNRNVAWGMSQRPDLVLAASSCKRPSEIESGSEDYRELNNVVAEAQREAGDKIKATIGTSLHKLTHMMDRGDTLGTVPARWQPDLDAYAQWSKDAGVEWVSVESFRVGDWWVKDISECDHKAKRYGGDCDCYGVAGTVDRIGWYRGRLRIFDIKTGSDFNKLGHAMQLAAYAHMVPYEYPGDTRGFDDVDLDVGHIIYLPEGKGHVRMETMDLRKGWDACQLAKQVWDARKYEVVLEEPVSDQLWRMTQETNLLAALKQYWKVWKADGLLTEEVKDLLRARATELKAKGVTK
jgi:PD-(D/E)XK nuclease superfamily